jgi:hypothetical protein
MFYSYARVSTAAGDESRPGSTHRAMRMDTAQNLADAQLTLEREKWKSEFELKQRELTLKAQEQNNRDIEVELKRKEQSHSKWSNPLVVAIFAAAIAGGGMQLLL